MVLYPEGLTPAQVDRLVLAGGGSLVHKLGIELEELSAEYSRARMPVETNTQVIGLLHGGAHLVLGETLGSISAGIHAGPGRYALGLEIGATHTRSVSSGFVSATCTAIHLGASLAVHEIVVRDEKNKRLSTIRMTNILRGRPEQ
jgi:1,4-dihydroxy-2-naphthoyl-CoA hydrolase